MYNSVPPPREFLKGKPKREENVWAQIIESSRYLEILASIKHNSGTLLKATYTIESPNGEELELLKRCQDCHRRVRKVVTPNIGTSPPFETKDLEKSPQVATKSAVITETISKVETPLMICVYHPGEIVKRFYTCCKKAKFPKTKGCISREYHIPEIVDYSNFAKLHEFYETPTMDELELLSLKLTENLEDQNQESEHAFPSFRTAIVLDCEMGTAVTGVSELIRLTAIDYFTREVLIDSLVVPDVEMLNYHTPFSGVSKKDLLRAKGCNKFIQGHDNAREMLWKYVGRHTLVIMHAGQNDMNCLRWIHPQVIDTHILEFNRGSTVEGGKSLRNLAAKLTEKVIQVPGGAHCSLEDCLATREVCDWYVRQILED